jgi:hypothetical protein
MTGDCHVRFYQRLGVKLPRPTNLWPFLSNEGTDLSLTRRASYAPVEVKRDTEEETRRAGEVCDDGSF